MTDLTTSRPNQGFDAFTFLARFAPLIFLLLSHADLRHHGAALPLLDQPVQRHAAGLDHRAPRHRMTFVILTAGIDLSIGSLLAFAGLVAAAVAKGGHAGPLHRG